MTRISSKWTAVYKFGCAIAPIFHLLAVLTLLLLAARHRTAVSPEVTDSQVPFLLMFSVLLIAAGAWHVVLWKRYYRCAEDVFRDNGFLISKHNGAAIRIPVADVISENAPFGRQMALRVLLCRGEGGQEIRIVYFPPIKSCLGKKPSEPGSLRDCRA